MVKVLSVVIVLALHSMIFDSFLIAAPQKKEAQKIKHEYYVNTDLSAGKFSEAFCSRLSDKHNWNKVSSAVSTDETYTSIFRFKDESSHSWQCEVQISRVRDESSNVMHVEMTMTQSLES
jgi:hypothetical protein